MESWLRRDRIVSQFEISPAEPSLAVPDVFLKSLSDRLGLGFGLDRYAAAEPEIRKTIKRRASGSTAAFLAAIGRDQKLLHELIETIVVPESHFFRHPQHFVFLRDNVLPHIARQGRRFRIWSAGCSTGEEPYSIAILLHQMGLAGQGQVYGTDISRNALNKARNGVYGVWSMRGVEDWPGASRYFKRTAGGRYQLSRKIRDLVSFRELNLAAPFADEPDSFASMNVILCRNVLIYMTAETTGEITTRLTEALAPGGWLIPGPSDPLARHKSLSPPFITPSGIFYRHLGSDFAPAKTASEHRSVIRQPVVRKSPPPVVDARRPVRSNTAPPRPPVRDIAPRGQPRRIPPTDHTLRAEIDLLVNAGRSDEALTVVNRAVERDPLSAEFHFLAAFVHWHRTALNDALACLKNVLYLDPKCAAAHQMRGMILAQSGQSGAARREFWAAYRLAVRLPENTTDRFMKSETAGQLARAAQLQIWNLRNGRGAR